MIEILLIIRTHKVVKSLKKMATQSISRKRLKLSKLQLLSFILFSPPIKLITRMSCLPVEQQVELISSSEIFLPKIANIAFRCRKFPIYNVIIDGILQQTNQYVGKLLLIVYFSVFFVFVNIRLTINYIQVNTAHVLFTTFKAEWRK